MEEIWKPVVGFEGLYEVSNLGRVKSLKFGKEKIMKPRIKNNYVVLVLRKNNKQKHFNVSRLVLISFIGEDKERKECDHIDRNPRNNKLNNLRWVTRSENCSNRNNYGKSKYKGVSLRVWRKKDGTLSENVRAIAQITVNGKSQYIGAFNTEEEAYEACKQAHLNHYGYEWMG
jgi:hypothetical protein